MRNNLRNLLSVPVFAIAAMAFTTANADAQCPGGCFGYPTPSQPTFRTFVPAVQFQRVEIVPVQTFVQPEIIIAPQQFTPAPLQQTFVSQPAIVESGIVNVPQNFPQPVYPGLPEGAYNVQPILPMQLGLPVQQPFAVETGTQVIPPVTKPMDTDSTDGMEEDVEEGQIEGEIISPADGVSEAPSVLQQDNASDMPLTAARGLEAEKAAMEKAAMEKAAMEKAAMEKAAMEKAAMEKAAMEKAAMEKAEKEKAEKEKTAKEKAEMKKAEKEKAAMEKAEKEKAEKEKAAMLEKVAMAQQKANKEAAERLAKEQAAERKAAKEKAEMEKAAKEKAAKEKAAKEKAEKKVLTKEERIANLENSLKRQIKRAKQVSKRNLDSKLEELQAADATDAAIEAAKLESADALKAKLAEIENRIQARIDQLKE